MTQALSPAFFGKVVPLAGQRKPPSPLVPTRTLVPDLERLPDGRYLQTTWMRNRCENLVEVGARTVYVVGDYGFLVAVEDRGRAWW